MDKLAVLMRFKPTQADAAAFFKCSEDTIDRRIRDETGLSYAEFREQNMVHTRMNLVQTAIRKAEKGDNVMLIFCLKNLCGWRDKQPGEEPAPIQNNQTLTVTDEQLRTLVSVARGVKHEAK
jgi:hypothetical protein